MSLDTKLLAFVQRVAAVVKQRGVPSGGAAGQLLAKAAAGDYLTEWVDPPAGGGTALPSPPLLTAPTLATIPAADGLYLITSGAEAGQVWERSGGVLGRRADLEGGGGSSPAIALVSPGPGAPVIQSYTVNPAPSATYPDSGGELTNGGMPGAAYQDAGWVGFPVSCTITVDMGVASGLAGLSVYAFGGGGGGIFAPSVGTLSRSADNANWTQAGTANWPDVGIAWYTVQGDSVGARYWRVDLTMRPNAGWIFVGEIAVIGSVAVVNGLPAGRTLHSAQGATLDPAGIAVTGTAMRVDVVEARRVLSSHYFVAGDVWSAT